MFLINFWHWFTFWSCVVWLGSNGAVPSLTTLATVRCQSTLFSEALMSCVGLKLSFHDAHKLSTRYFSLWRPPYSSPLYPPHHHQILKTISWSVDWVTVDNVAFPPHHCVAICKHFVQDDSKPFDDCFDWLSSEQCCRNVLREFCQDVVYTMSSLRDVRILLRCDVSIVFSLFDVVRVASCVVSRRRRCCIGWACAYITSISSSRVLLLSVSLVWI